MGKKKETKVTATEIETPAVEVKKTHAELDELKGQVKQVKETFFKAKKRGGEIVAGDWEGDRGYRKNFLITFDEKGQKVEEHVFGPSGETYLMQFNERGDLWKQTYRKSDGSLEFKSENIFNEKGYDTEQFLTYPDGKIMSRTAYTNDEQGRHIKSVHYNHEGAISYTCNYTYNEDTIISNMYSQDADGKTTSSHNWIYDLDYNVLEETEYDAAGNITESDKIGRAHV